MKFLYNNVIVLVYKDSGQVLHPIPRIEVVDSSDLSILWLLVVFINILKTKPFVGVLVDFGWDITPTKRVVEIIKFVTKFILKRRVCV